MSSMWTICFTELVYNIKHDLGTYFIYFSVWGVLFLSGDVLIIFFLHFSHTLVMHAND